MGVVARGRVPCLAVLLLLLAVCGGAHAATLRVTVADDSVVADGECTLREAVIAANGATNECGSGDTSGNVILVNFLETPTLFLTIPGAPAENAAATGDLDVTRPLTITSESGRVVIDALSLFNAFHVLAGGRLTLNGIEVRNGYSSTDGVAGGITNAGDVLTLNDCVMRFNHFEGTGSAGIAAGAVASDAVVQVADSAFYSNVASTSNPSSMCAGAIAAAASVVVSDGVFEGNRGLDSSFSGGSSGPTCAGAIGVQPSVSGVVNVQDSSFVRNTGVVGGAIGAISAALTVDDTELIENTASVHGGALFSTLDILVDGGATIPSVVGNVAIEGNGGVAASFGGSVEIDTVDTLHRNKAGGDGGVAFALYQATINVVSHDISFNSARRSGGVLFAEYGGADITYVGGAVTTNTAGYFGGVVYAADNAQLSNVNLYVSRNVADSGGVAYVRDSTGNVLIDTIGPLYENKAGTLGGVVFVSGTRGETRLRNIAGDIRGNVAQFGGVVWANQGRVVISDVYGSVESNVGVLHGGVIADVAGENVLLRDITGHVRGNAAGALGGVVMSSGASSNVVEITYIGGNVENNVAGDSGGVVFAGDGDVYLHNVAGHVSGNTLQNEARFDYSYIYYRAEAYLARFATVDGAGAVIFADGDVSIDAIGGDISSNSAGSSGHGGVIYASGAASLTNVTGSLSRNIGVGSVVYASTLQVSAIGGDISYNSGPVFSAFAGDAFNGGSASLSDVGGSIIANVCILDFLEEVDNIIDFLNVIEHYQRSTGVIGGSFTTITDVQGDIAYNKCYFGGVLRAQDTGIIQNVGNIHHNAAILGGVAYSVDGNIEIRYAGNISYNSASGSGGVVMADTSFTIVNVGNMVANFARQYGGVAYADGPGFVSNTGAIEHNNAGELGGAFYSEGNFAVEQVNGDIAYNSADFGAGFAFHRGDGLLTIEQVNGDVIHNSSQQGGLVLSYAYTNLLRNIYGDVSYNVATDGDGGVLWALYGTVSLDNVTGDVSYNAAGGAGGVFYVLNQSLLIENVAGDIAFNISGSTGGVAYANSEVLVSNIGGNIIRNTAQDSGGAFASENDTIQVEYVSGSILYNVCGDEGGFAYAEDNVELHDIAGDLSYNTALNGGGGVAYSTDQTVVVRDIGGSISNNSAGDDGGAFYAYLSVTIHNVGGAIERNFSLDSGGVAFASGVLDVYNVGGNISFNHAADNGGAFGTYSSATVRYVYGSVEYNTISSGQNNDAGGVIYAEDYALLSHVSGSVSYNSALGYGGVIMTYDSGAIEHIDGSIVGNSTFRAGGVIYAARSARVSSIGGEILNNRLSAPYDSSSLNGGGVIAAGDGVSVYDIGGRISGNEALGRASGGVAQSRTGNVYIGDVRGDVSWNRAGDFGGVAAALDGSVELENITGGVADNVSLSHGGVAYARDTATVLDVGGAINRNSSGARGGVLFALEYASIVNTTLGISYNRADHSGGVVYVYRGNGVIRNTGGSIEQNTCGEHGAVLYANATCVNPTTEGVTTVQIDTVSGSIRYNSANVSGGVITTRACTSYVTIANVTGDVSYNVVHSLTYDSAHGGVVYHRSGFGNVHILNVTGNISGNGVYASGSNEAYGGVVSGYGASALIENIGGSISSNRAAFGGVLFLDRGDAEMRAIDGDISYNTAQETGGVIMTGQGGVLVYDIGGSIIKNEASTRNGGFSYCDSTSEVSTVRDVSGDIKYNHAGDYGGFMYVRTYAVVTDVVGELSFNNAFAGFGGLVCARYGDAVLERVGAITHNSANGSGGAVYAGESITVRTVNGGVTNNLSRRGSGGAFAADGFLLVENIDGDVSNNTGLYGGAVYSDGAACVLRNTLGSMCRNTANASGGAVWCNEGASVLGVSGDVCNNKASDHGGVVWSDEDSLLSGVRGEVYGNTAVEGSGGVVYGRDSATIIDVNGAIEDSHAGRNGGVVFVYDGPAVITDIGGGIVDATAGSNGGAAYGRSVEVTALGGSIERCIAAGYGGFAMAYGGYGYNHSIAVDGVIGSITDCAADFGGVAYTDVDPGAPTASGPTVAAIFIRNVSGDISRNLALDGYGGVAAAYSDVYGPVVIENVGGSVTDNEAGQYGGVVYTGGPDEGDVTISNVDGDVSFNKALLGSGGVVYSADDVELSEIGGRICSNTAYYDGGVGVARTGSAVVVNVGDGPIQDNVAGQDGGVLWALNDALVDAGNGLVLNNSPDVVFSQNGGIESVTGSVVISGSPVLTIVDQPGDGLENTPLTVQPEIVVSGAVPSHELPIRVVVVEEGGDETVLDGPFNAVFGATMQFQDLAVPFAADNITLRFELVTLVCGEADETVLASATSVRFDVGECASPEPVVCPNDIVVNAKQHECSAFVSVPGPISTRCSNPTVTHSTTPALSSSVADGEYPVGSTLVTYSAENAAGVSDECVLEVTVVDAEAPVITCPGNVVVSNDANQCGASVALPAATATDNCDDANVAVTSDRMSNFFPVGTTEVTFTATDDDGNFATCTMSVTVVDVEPPVIACPSDVVLGCGALPTFSEPQGTDNCPGAQTFQRAGPAIGSTTPLPPGISTFEFEVIDAVGERAACRFQATTASDWYLDADGDGIGQSGTPITQCPAPGPNYVEDRTGDCDDTNPNLSRLLYPDADEDGFGNTFLAICSPPEDELTRRGIVTTVLIAVGGDCDDANPLVNPGQLELCNGIDDNCNGQIDEGCVSPESPPSIPTVPLPPAAPLAPEASKGTIIIIPTPLPESPSSVDPQIIIVQPAIQSASAGSTLSVILVFVLGVALFNLLW